MKPLDAALAPMLDEAELESILRREKVEQNEIPQPLEDDE
jgi:hypothetical protein